MKLLWCLIFLTLSFHLYAYDELCSRVRIKNLKKLKLTDNEKLLLCGDKKTPAYRYIPSYQAKYFLKGFLQSRGYLRPKMKIEDNVLYAHHGPLAKIKKIYVRTKEVPKLKRPVQDELRHLYKRRVLTTNVLNAVEADGLAEVRNRGYPCAKVSSQADVDKNNIHLGFENLGFHEFGKIGKEEVGGLRDNALDRFYPFQSNDPFNADLLRLTEKRMTRAEVVQGTYFLEACEGEDFSLQQRFILGPPRSLRYGVGASTEMGPMARVRWSNNRYKSMASQLAATAQASLRSQSLTLTADSFFWKHEPRRSVYSVAEVVRENQADYEQVVYRLNPSIKWTRDSEGFHKLYSIGPSYESVSFRSNVNSDTRAFATGIIQGNAQWMGHDYELFDILPAKGNFFSLNFDFRHPSMGFVTPLLKLNSNAIHIDRLTNWGRGTVIGAVHANVGTTFVDIDKASQSSLPPTVKFFGGGSDDVRGFYLRTLPKNDGAGALTKAMLKMELRRTHFFLQSLEAFTFFDGAYFGDSSFNLEPQLYYSPGIGVRWLSPIGLVQSFVARGLTSAPYQDAGNLYYIGIGGSF